MSQSAVEVFRRKLTGIRCLPAEFDGEPRREMGKEQK